MKKKFDFLMAPLTGVISYLGILAAAYCWGFLHNGSVMMSVFIAVLLFVIPMTAGFLTMQLVLLFQRKKYNLQTKGAFVRFVAVLLVTAVLAAVSQLLYCFEWQTYSTEKVIENKTKGSHVVLLMDISGSMKDERSACIDAACELVNSLDENTSMQFIAFAGTVEPRNKTAFLNLTPDNKLVVQDVIRNVKMEGGTNFNYPLEEAMDTLIQNQDPDYRSMILLLTDGREATVNAQNKQKLRDNSQIELFSLRVVPANATISKEEKELMELAVKDFPLEQQKDGSLDMSTVLQTFKTAINHKKVEVEWHKKLAMGSDVVFGSDNQGYWWRAVTQIVMFTLYSVLLSVAYYGKPGIPSLILSLAAGALTGWVAGIDVNLMGFVLAILCLSAYTVYEVGEGPQNV